MDRERMTYKDGTIVTVLDRTLPKSGKVSVRTTFGFVKQVNVKDLTKLADDDPMKKLSYKDTSA